MSIGFTKSLDDRMITPRPRRKLHLKPPEVLHEANSHVQAQRFRDIHK